MLPFCNTEAMQLHLDEIATKVTPGAHAILILDQAGWHGAKRLRPPGNISLLPLASGRVDAQEPGQPARGLALAQQVCAACHAIDKRTEASPNPVAPRFEVIANVPGMTPMALTVALRTPHKTMPNLVLDDDEIRNVAAYILSLN